MQRAELAALVAGRALSENVVHEIECRGLNFQSTAQDVDVLKLAGATPAVLEALQAAKPGPSVEIADRELLQHLAQAASLGREEVQGFSPRIEPGTAGED